MIEFKFFNEEWNEEDQVKGSDTNVARVAGSIEDADTDEE
jgi:hypothetical protein